MIIFGSLFAAAIFGGAGYLLYRWIKANPVQAITGIILGTIWLFVVFRYGPDIIKNMQDDIRHQLEQKLEQMEGTPESEDGKSISDIG